MSRGIQKNTTAWDEESKYLDETCKTSKTILIKKLSYITDLNCKNKIPKNIIPGGIGACAPDGGAWFYKNKLICAFEAKKQQNRGNAIERWYKNNFICRVINPNISYVTFASGEGAISNGVIQNTLHIAHYNGGINHYEPGKNTIYYEVNGFILDKIVHIMENVILERIENENR